MRKGRATKPRKHPHLTPWLGSPLAKDLTNGATISVAAIGFRPDEEFPARIGAQAKKKSIPSSFWRKQETEETEGGQDGCDAPTIVSKKQCRSARSSSAATISTSKMHPSMPNSSVHSQQAELWLVPWPSGHALKHSGRTASTAPTDAVSCGALEFLRFRKCFGRRTRSHDMIVDAARVDSPSGLGLPPAG